ncbi:MAG: DUF308 domain-containing protein [Methanocella sp.]
MLVEKPSATFRIIEIILGITALVIGGLALAFPVATVVSIVVFFGIALVAVGVLRLATGASSDWLPSSIRRSNSIIGILAIIFGAIILFAPFFATEVLVILIGLGLLIYGVGRVVAGGVANRLSGGLRAVLVVMGLLVVVFSLIVIFFPLVGVLTYAVFVSLAFIMIGVDSLASGILGAKLV